MIAARVDHAWHARGASRLEYNVGAVDVHVEVLVPLEVIRRESTEVHHHDHVSTRVGHHGDVEERANDELRVLAGRERILRNNVE